MEVVAVAVRAKMQTPDSVTSFGSTCPREDSEDSSEEADSWFRGCWCCCHCRFWSPLYCRWSMCVCGWMDGWQWTARYGEIKKENESCLRVPQTFPLTECVCSAASLDANCQPSLTEHWSTTIAGTAAAAADWLQREKREKERGALTFACYCDSRQPLSPQPPPTPPPPQTGRPELVLDSDHDQAVHDKLMSVNGHCQFGLVLGSIKRWYNFRCSLPETSFTFFSFFIEWQCLHRQVQVHCRSPSSACMFGMPCDEMRAWSYKVETDCPVLKVSGRRSSLPSG